jgi:hypothetical protein
LTQGSPFHIYPKLNHLFVAGEGKPNPSEDERAGHVSAKAIDHIVNWVQK